MRCRWVRWVSNAAVAGALTMLAACGSTRAPITWIIASSALTRLESVPGAAVLAKDAFDNAHTYVLVSSGMQPSFLQSWRSVRTIDVTSFSELAKVVEMGVPADVRAVVYDQEDWSFTPVAEQKDPSHYMAEAQSLLHEHHLTLIATPATDLVRAVRTPLGGPSYLAFLHLGLAGAIARYANIFEIQSQGVEASLGEFTTFVDQAAAQARSTNPHVIVLAGLSTNPTGHTVTAEELFQDVQATRGVVAGYWLNIPTAGPSCPSCGTPKPEVAAQLLRALEG